MADINLSPLFWAKPLSEMMLVVLTGLTGMYISYIKIKPYLFSYNVFDLKMSSENGGHNVSALICEEVN